MIHNLLISYLRNFRKNKMHYALSLGGLAIGIACSLFVYLFIQDELSFDRYHERAGNIYRIVFGESDQQGSALTSHVMGSALQQSYPSLKIARFNNAGNARANFKVGENQFPETGFFFTDADVFEIFSFPLKDGDETTALHDPFTVVLTKSAAQKYFGTHDVINKTIAMEWGTQWYDLKITGVMNDVPVHSHFTFDFLISMATAEKLFQPQSFFTDWTANFCYNYVWIPDGDLNRIEDQLEQQYKNNVSAELSAGAQVRFQKLTDIHLHSKLIGELNKNADIKYIYLAACTALLVLVICVINYTNILIALYSRRIKEIGVRKVLGAKRSEIARQFVAESVLNVFIALSIACILTGTLYPYFLSLINKSAQLEFPLGFQEIGLALVCSLMLGIFTGLFPAIFLSGFSPSSILFGKVSQLFRGGRSKKVLAAIQVLIAVLMITGAIAFHKQLKFLEGKNLGYNKSRLLMVPQGRILRERAESIKNELFQTRAVTQVSFSSHIPSGSLNFKVPVLPEGGNPDGTTNPWPVSVVSVDTDFLNAYELNIVQGRFFSTDYASDSTEAFVINETAAKTLGWTEPVGKTLEMTFNVGDGTTETRKGRVIGVVKDFHFESLHKSIEPLIMMNKRFWYYYITMRLSDESSADNIETLRSVWERINPGNPFDFVFITDRLDRMYASERSWSDGIGVSSSVAIIITCIGIFSLISFITQSRIKEMSIRKVLGATPQRITLMMLSDLIQLIGIAAVVAVPIAHYALEKWLESFAYRIPVMWSTYAIALITIMIIGIGISLHQILKAAYTNPIRHINSEN